MNQNTKHFLDYYLINEIINNSSICLAAHRAKEKLQKNHQIKLSKKAIYSAAKKIFDKKYIIHPAAVLNGIPGVREGKEQNYLFLWKVLEFFYPNSENRKYIGLANNQVDVLRDKFQTIAIYEKNKQRYSDIENLIQKIVKYKQSENQEILLFNQDIFKTEIKKTYNFIDLDLMCVIPKDHTEILNFLNNVCVKEGYTIIHLSFCVGRSITEIEHRTKADKLIKEIGEHVGKVEYRSKFSYRDRKTPMRSERLLINRDKGE